MKKYVFLIISLLAAILLLSGCSYSAQLNTELIVNDNLSGSRIIYCQYENSAENGNTVSDKVLIDTINKAIKGTPLAFSKSGNEYRLTLSFSSIDDYRQKISDIFEISGSDFIPEINIITGDQTSVYENFSSLELLQGIIDKCGEYALSVNPDAFLDISCGSNTVTIGGSTANVATERISYSAVSADSLVPVSVMINNRIMSSDSISRTIHMQFDSSAVSVSRESIEQEMTRRLSGVSAQTSWEENTFIIEHEGGADSISRMTEAALDCTDRISFDRLEDSETDLEEFSLSESLTFSSISEYEYCMENSSNFAVSDISGTSQGEIIPPEKDGASWRLSANGAQLEINCTAEHRTYAQKAFVTLQNKGNNIFKREYRFVYEDASEIMLQSLCRSFNEKISERICSVQENGLVIAFEGDIDRINRISSMLFGAENKLELQSERSAFDTHSSFNLRDNILLSAEVYTSGRTDDIVYRYIPFNEKLADGKEQSISNGMAVEIDGTVINRSAVFAIILSALSAALLVLLLTLMILRRSRRKAPKTKLPPGSYATSKGVIVLPSTLAQRREKTVSRSEK